MKEVFSLIKDETGIALPLVIFVVLALSLLGIILFNYNMAETTQVARDEHRLKAHYLARSGAHAVAQHLIDNPDQVEEIISHGGESGEVTVPLGEGEYGKFQVLVYKGMDPSGEEEEEDIVYVESTGIFGNARQKVLVSIKTEGISAAMITSDFDITGTAFAILDGDVVFINDKSYYDDQNQDDDLDIIEGNLEEGYIIDFQPNLTFEEVILPCADEKSVFFGPCPVEPLNEHNLDHDLGNSGEITIDRNAYYKSIKAGNQASIEINPTDVDNLLLKVDDMDIRCDITVKIGGGKVVALVMEDYSNARDFIIQQADDDGGHFLLYVNNFLKDDAGNQRIVFKDKEGDEVEYLENVHINVFVTEHGTFNLQGTKYFEASIYAPNADAILAGNSTIKGWVVTKYIKFQGGTGLEYSPIVMLDSDMDLKTRGIDKWRYGN